MCAGSGRGPRRRPPATPPFVRDPGASSLATAPGPGLEYIEKIPDPGGPATGETSHMPTNLKKLAYDHIRMNLFNGNLSPGMLLSAVALAKEYGMSQTPVREAISQLETEGLVEPLPRMGACVKWIDRRELEELFEIREILESGAHRQGGRAPSPTRLSRSSKGFVPSFAHRTSVRRRQAGNDFEAIAEKLLINDVAFHLTLFGAADDRRMRKIVADLHLMTHVLFRRQWDTPSLSVVTRHTLDVSRSFPDHACGEASRLRPPPVRRWAGAHASRPSVTFCSMSTTGPSVPMRRAWIRCGRTRLQRLIQQMVQSRRSGAGTAADDAVSSIFLGGTP